MSIYSNNKEMQVYLIILNKFGIKISISYNNYKDHLKIDMKVWSITPIKENNRDFRDRNDCQESNHTSTFNDL